MSAFRFTFLITTLTLFAGTLTLDEEDLKSFGTELLDRTLDQCGIAPGCDEGLTSPNTVPQVFSISGWNNSACIDKPASEQVPVTATSGCYNYGSDVSGLRIDWATSDTWATVFNDFDCNSPSNLTVARDSDSLCQRVANGYGGVNQANIPGNPGSVLIGTGSVPSQISTSSADGDNLGVLTSFFGYEGCSSDEKSQINQAQKDAVMLAANAVKSSGIDFGNSAAALEYFGPGDETQSQGTRQQIIGETPYLPCERSLSAEWLQLDSLVGASTSYPGWGWSDWWNGKYIDLRCSTGPECFGNKTEAGEPVKVPVIAYYRPSNSFHDDYPTITFCPAYFAPNIPSLNDAIANVKKIPARMGWALALRSKATFFLHETFHIDFGKAQISNPAGIDHYVTVGTKWYQETTMAISPGRAKLLALIKNGGVKMAAYNNDNLVYYIVSEYMVKLYGSYPAKPRAWNPQLSIAQNQWNNEDQFARLKPLLGLATDGGLSLLPDEFNLTADYGWEGDFDDAEDSGVPVDDTATPLTLQDLYTDADYPANFIAAYGSVV